MIRAVTLGLALVIWLSLVLAPAPPVVHAAVFPLTDRLPDGVPGPETLAGWERVQGDTTNRDGHRVVYRFHVDPARGALYRLTQYQVMRPARAGATDSGPALETEKLFWNAAPGSRRPIECFERFRAHGWATLWLGNDWHWRRLEPGSPAYLAEMATAIRVYHLHRSRLEP